MEGWDWSCLLKFVSWMKISLCPFWLEVPLTPNETKKTTSKKPLKIIKHDNSGLSLIRGRLWCTPCFGGSSCICYKWSVTVPCAHYSWLSPLISPPLSTALCKTPALRLQNKRNPLMLFLLPLLDGTSLPGGSRWGKSSPSFPSSCAKSLVPGPCWHHNRQPVPREDLGSGTQASSFKQLRCSNLLLGLASWNKKWGRKEGARLGKEQEKAGRNTKGGKETRTRSCPSPLLSKPAGPLPSLRLLLTWFTRPAPVRKPSHLPQFTLWCFVLLSALIQAPFSALFPSTLRALPLASRLGLTAGCFAQIFGHMTTPPLESRSSLGILAPPQHLRQTGNERWLVSELNHSFLSIQFLKLLSFILKKNPSRCSPQIRGIKMHLK